MMQAGTKQETISQF